MKIVIKTSYRLIGSEGSIPHIFDIMDSKMLIFFLKTVLNLTKRLQILVFLILIIDVTYTTRRPVWGEL